MYKILKTEFYSTHHPFYTPLKLTCFILLILAGSTNIWGQSFCEAYKGIQPTTTHPDSLAYDRFGNAFHIDLLAIPPAVAGAIPGADCNSGYFNLTFYGTPPPAAPADPNHAICSVFSYLSDNITRQQGATNCGTTALQNVNLQVAWVNFANPDPAILTQLGIAPGPINGAGIGSPFTTAIGGFNCKELAPDRPFIKINGGIPPGGSAGFDGRILLNTNINWNYDENAANFPDQLDLYSVVLHEALHVLGFASRMSQTDLFSLWDQTLRVVDAYTSGGGGANPRRAIMTTVSTGNQLSCTRNCWKANTTLPGTINSLAIQPCSQPAADIVIGDAAIAAVGGYNDGSSIDNILSHLNESCNSASDMVDYVMSPGIAFNQIQRTVSDPEWEILCALGYTTTSCGGCYSIAHPDDRITANAQCCYKLFYGCHGSPIEVLKSDLLCNDITNGGDLDIVHLYNASSLTIVPNAAGNGWIITNNIITSFASTVYYSISGCDCKMHDNSFSVFFERQCPDCIYQGDMCENLLCYNDFENYTSTGGFVARLTHPFILEGNQLVGTPDLRVANGNHYLFTGGGPDFNIAIEPVAMELQKCIAPRCSLLFEVSLQKGGQGFLEIWGSTSAPCDISENVGAFVSDNCGTSTICNASTTFNPHCISNLTISNEISIPFDGVFDPSDLQQFTWVNDTDDDICFLTLIPRNGHVYLDNIEAKIRCKPEITCKYQGNPEICNDETSTMEWLVCAEDIPGNTSTTVNFEITLPTGVNAVNPGQLKQTITIAEGDCVTVSVEVTTTLPVGDMFKVSLMGSATGICEEATFECSEKITVVECGDPDCACPPNSVFINGGTANTNPATAIPGISVMNTPLTEGQTNSNTYLNYGRCMTIQGNLVIDNNFDLKIIGGEIIMLPGARITVKSGAKLRLEDIKEGEASNPQWLGIHGCDNMWRSIVAEPGATLEMKGNIIQDAEFAVDIQGNSLSAVTFDAEDNDFDRNHVGIQINGKVLQTNPFSNNKFRGSALLTPFFSTGITNWSPLKPFVGIIVRSSVFNIGKAGDATNINEFNRIRNGVFVQSASTVEIHFAKFTTIWGTQPINQPGGAAPLGLQGMGVYARSSYLLKVYDCTFGGEGSNGARAIDVARCNLEAVRNDIYDLLSGVYVFPATVFSNRYIITDNKFRTNLSSFGSSQAGFVISGITGTAGEIKILRNKPIQIRSAGGYGIKVMNDPGHIFKLLNRRISGNEISHTQPGGDGLMVDNSTGWVIDDNLVEYSGFPASTIPAAPWSRGIKMASAHDCFIKDNKVYGLDGGSYDATNMKAFEITSSQRCTLCCNTSNGSETGFDFFGACAPLTLNQSRIQNHHLGINCHGEGIIPGGTSISDQPWRGNTWEGSYFIGAAHSGSQQNIESSEFYVETPLTTQFWPNSYAPSTPGVWFKEDNTSTSTACTTLQTCSELPPATNPGTPGEIRADDQLIASGKYAGEGINDRTLQRESERDLYRLLMQNSDLIGKDSVIDAFYYRSASDIIGALYEIDKAIAALSEPAMGNISARTKEIDSLLLILNGIDAQWSKTLNTTQRTALITAKSAQINTLQDALTDWLTLSDATQNTQISTDIPAIISTIEALKGTDEWVNNIKAVYKVFLETVAQGNTSANTKQLKELQKVADQCVLSGGDAVVKARVLYQVLSGDTQYRPVDDDICGKVQSERSEKQLPVNVQTLYEVALTPNPARELVWVNIAGVDAGIPIQVQIYDLNGKMLLDISGENGAAIKPKLNNGVFICRIFQDGKFLGHSKLAFIR